MYRNSAERETRFQIFKDNMVKMQNHNLAGKSWSQGVNKFSDLSGNLSKIPSEKSFPSPKYIISARDGVTLERFD